MTSYGNKIACPHCQTAHVIRMGEIGNQRQVTFTCTSCGQAVAIDQAAEKAVVPVQAGNEMGFKLKGVD
jgi:predicted RNA-binding Zn-ribbon protein involved in translation (DUF1610 family)